MFPIKKKKSVVVFLLFFFVVVFLFFLFFFFFCFFFFFFFCFLLFFLGVGGGEWYFIYLSDKYLLLFVILRAKSETGKIAKFQFFKKSKKVQVIMVFFAFVIVQLRLSFKLKPILESSLTLKTPILG